MADVFNNAFPQTGGGGAAATPTISVVDNEDGTATVTVSGLTTETVTVEYFQAAGSWLTLGTRVGNGTVTGAVTGAPGTFWFVATADDSGDQEMSDPVALRITTSAPAITPAWWLSLELHNLRESIVASDTWKAIVELPDDEWPAVSTLADAGTSDAAAARAKVILERTDEDDAAEDPPRCIIRHATDGDLERVGGQSWSTEAQLMLLIELPIPSTLVSDKEASLYDFGNKVGRMMTEILLASETGGERLNVLRAGRGPIGQLDPKDIRGDSLRVAEFLLTAPGVLV